MTGAGDHGRVAGGIDPLEVGALSDAELQAEIDRRRRRRGRPTGAAGRTAGRERIGESRLAQAYANLELSPGSPLEKVQARYRELLERYDPGRFDDERRQTAEVLVARLREAYDTLRGALSGERRAGGGDG